MIPANSSSSSTGLLLSGGLDSAILLGHLLGQGQRVQPFYIRSHLRWEAAELHAVRLFLAAVARPGLANLVVLDLPLADLYQDRHWSLSGHVPDAATPDEAVYLPGRNPLLLIKAALWCQLHGIPRLALALLASNPFADATAQFFESYQKALTLAAGRPIELLRPFAQLHKPEVMQLGTRPAAGVDLLLPVAGCEPALRPVQ